IVEALHLNLTAEEQRRAAKHPTENIEAYDLYLKGRYFQDKRTPEGVAKSIDYFKEATIRDPRFALAFAALADSYVVLAIRADMLPKDSYQLAKAAAVHALEIDAATAEAHSTLANVKAWYEWDWPAAEREFKRAIELSVNDPVTYQQYATYLIATGRHQEAIAAIEHAQRLAPLSLTTNAQAARILFFTGRYDAGIEQCRKTLDMDPDFGGAHLMLGRIYAQKRMYGEALVELERARALLRNSAEVLSVIGYTHAASGHPAEARQVLEELRGLSKQRYVSPYHIAMIHAALGDRDEAFQWLEEAYDDREGRMTILRFAPEFATLRSDPRFTDLLKRMKLV
ncbi:MAG: tetratricopeptide repeat protein, partial [Thermoanaerobaculia bacterium]